MSRDPYRSSGDLGRTERWDRDRFVFERERDRYGDEREQFEERDHVYTRDAPLRERMRERSADRLDRRYSSRVYEDDVVFRDRRIIRDDEPRYLRRSPPPAEVDRRVVIEKEREREYARSPSPPRRPGALLRRQSSLDTFDRRPTRYYEREREREDYGPPARREDYRSAAFAPIPLPRSRALPPPRRHAERDFYEDIKVSDPDYYGDEEFRPYPERIREKEIIRTRRRNRSRESRRSHGHHGSSIRSSSRSSSVTSSSSSTSGGTTVKSEYPKKGKTRIPVRLVSKRALIDLGYPYEEEGNTIVVQKALGQENIDDLLKLSEDYKKSELEVAAARSERGDIIEERRTEVYVAPAAPPPPPAVIVAGPPSAQPVELINKTTVIRDVSPARSRRSRSTSVSTRVPVIVEARPREVSEEIPIGPLALVTADRRSRSRDGRAIRAEIRDLEYQLARRDRHERRSEREIVKAERFSDGQLVLYEERVEKVEEPSRGVRVEKDKKGPPPKLVRAMLATLT